MNRFLNLKSGGVLSLLQARDMSQMPFILTQYSYIMTVSVGVSCDDRRVARNLDIMWWLISWLCGRHSSIQLDI